ncbi:MAG: hypothetical protein M0R80_28150 [Proteobacteria bacterium]|jgi:hypothetical protein|nr:hypothetical protein [Pseudomonadota bacterium]
MFRECGYTDGWQGFSGWLQALSAALPSVGLYVDLANIVWPWVPPEA